MPYCVTYVPGIKWYLGPGYYKTPWYLGVLFSPKSRRKQDTLLISAGTKSFLTAMRDCVDLD